MRAPRRVRIAPKRIVLPPAATEREPNSSKKPAIYNYFFTRVPRYHTPKYRAMVTRRQAPARTGIRRFLQSAVWHVPVPGSGPLSSSFEASREVEIALVLNELRDGDILDRDGVVGVGGDHRVAMPIISCGGQQGLEICKYRVIDFDHIRSGVEIRDGGVAEIGREYERVAIGASRCGRCGRG
jgi:hypothetical protein